MNNMMENMAGLTKALCAPGGPEKPVRVAPSRLYTLAPAWARRIYGRSAS